MVSVAVFCPSSASPREAAPVKPRGVDERHPSSLPVPGRLLGTRPFLGTGSWFCFLPTRFSLKLKGGEGDGFCSNWDQFTVAFAVATVLYSAGASVEEAVSVTGTCF